MGSLLSRNFRFRQILIASPTNARRIAGWQALQRERSIERVVGGVYSRSALGQRSQPTIVDLANAVNLQKWRHVEFLRGLGGSPAWFAPPKSTRELGVDIVMDSSALTISQHAVNRCYRHHITVC